MAVIRRLIPASAIFIPWLVAAAPSLAQPVAPPHLLGGIFPDWLGMAVGGFFVGCIPFFICIKIAEAIAGRWDESKVTLVLVIMLLLLGLFSWGYVIYFWVWVL